MIIEWNTPDERSKIGSGHRKMFKQLYTRANMIQDHETVNNFHFIRGSTLLSYNCIPSYRKVHKKLVPLKKIKSDKYFISHRWLASDHPDPHCNKLTILKTKIDPNSYYWIDYSCLPQHPRSKKEEKVFQESLKMLPSLLFEMKFLILRQRHDDYLKRAWCFFELLSASVIGKEITYALENKNLEAPIFKDEQEVLKQTIANNNLPDNICITIPAELNVIQEATQTVITFCYLNLLMHLLALGQKVSNEEYYRFEDPYYFMFAYDFSKLLRWTYNKLSEFNLNWTELSKNEHDENVFFKISQQYQFKHEADIYKLPKEVILNPNNLDWLHENRNDKKSEVNLFYILISLISIKDNTSGKEPVSEKSKTIKSKTQFVSKKTTYVNQQLDNVI